MHRRALPAVTTFRKGHVAWKCLLNLSCSFVAAVDLFMVNLPIHAPGPLIMVKPRMSSPQPPAACFSGFLSPEAW